MKKKIIVCLMLCFALSCAENPPSKNTSSNENTSTPTVKTSVEANKNLENIENTANVEAPKESVSATMPTKEECIKVDSGDKLVLESQTFPIDFKPFEGACFVTMHDAEYDDPPLGSEISIFKEGKQVYKFDSRFNPDAATCWVEAVAFEDLNADDLKDVIVVGKCGAKTGELFANEVFINTGKDFYTNISGNDALEQFDKIKDIADFVKKNEKLFEPNN